MKKNKFDAIFHFAAFKAVGDSMIAPEIYANNNIIDSINVLNKMVEYKIKYIIFSSTAAVYGEPEYIPIDEQHRLKPENYYGFSKIVIENNIKWYSKLKNIRYAILRYFNAAGYDVKGRISTIEKEVTNLIPVAMEALFGRREYLPVYGDNYPTSDGTCIRDFIHPNDLASAHIKALDYIMTKNEDLLVNLSQNSGTSVFEVIKAIERLTAKKLNYKIVNRRLGDPTTVIASNKLAFEKLQWQPQYSNIDTIIDTTYKVYKNVYGEP